MRAQDIQLNGHQSIAAADSFDGPRRKNDAVVRKEVCGENVGCKIEVRRCRLVDIVDGCGAESSQKSRGGFSEHIPVRFSEGPRHSID